MSDFANLFLSFLLRHRVKSALVLLNTLFGSLGIFFSLNGVLPLGLGNFIFFSILIFLMALYRPVWIFLLLIGMLPYEIVDLAPAGFGIFLRPYQWLMLILLLAVAIRSLAKRPFFSPFHFVWTDALPVLFLVGAFLSSFGSASFGSSGKLALILGSFVALFFLIRFFVRTEKAAVQLLPFLLSSCGVIIVWSITQNILFALGKESFQVMAGRPNGTFSEPDWLGMYLLFPIALSLAWLYRNDILRKRIRENILPTGMLFLGVLTLLLSMTRSAWLGLAGMGIFFSGAVLITFLKLGDPKRAFLLLGKSGVTVCLALAAVPILHLSRFSLFDRAISVGGVQEITIACVDAGKAPERIHDVGELAEYGCRHILLEEKESFLESGYIVREIGRDDPNISIRQSVYGRAVSLAYEHPLRGIGWGAIGSELGTDERGSALNASNMFLEFWLGSGLIGLFAFSLLWFAYGFQSGKVALTGGGSEVAFHLFFHLVWIGFSIFNLFNSGILLGIFFAFLGLGGILFSKIKE